MDYAAFHKKEELYQIAKKYSQPVICLPPYSPEYNPIAHTWSAPTGIGQIKSIATTPSQRRSIRLYKASPHRCSKSNAVIRIH